MHTIFGQRFHAYDPIVDHNTGEVIDDGQPKKVRLGQWPDERIAKNMAENIKTAVKKRSWKIWVE